MDIIEQTVTDPVYKAYKLLVDAVDHENLDPGELQIAVYEAIGYLGEALD